MTDATTPAAQWLLIVSTKSRALFEYLSMSFRDVPTVEVMLDRREGERRGRSARPTADRRRGDRRVSRGQRERYPLLGYVLVRRNGATPGAPRTGAAKADRTLPWPDDADTARTLKSSDVRTEGPGGSRRR